MEQPTRIRAEDIEEALAQVAEIKAARVVSSADGVIQEIHVLALPSKAPKQLVRDIESTIMADFGIPIDHKKISIAQLGQRLPARTDPTAPIARPRIIVDQLQSAGVKTTVASTLEIGGDRVRRTRRRDRTSQTGRQRLVAAGDARRDRAVHGDGATSSRWRTSRSCSSARSRSLSRA